MSPDVIEVCNAICMRIRLQKLADKQRLEASIERGRQVRMARLAATSVAPDWDDFEARNRALPVEDQRD